MEKKGLGICVLWIAEHEKLCPYYYFIMQARGFYFSVECKFMHNIFGDSYIHWDELSEGIVSIDRSIDQSTSRLLIVVLATSSSTTS